MKEIRELTGNGLPYRSREELVNSLVIPAFDILHSEEELISLSFDNPTKSTLSFEADRSDRNIRHLFPTTADTS